MENTKLQRTRFRCVLSNSRVTAILIGTFATVLSTFYHLLIYLLLFYLRSFSLARISRFKYIDRLVIGVLWIETRKIVLYGGKWMF